MAMPLRDSKMEDPVVRIDFDEERLKRQALSALVIDDEERYAENLRILLEDLGYSADSTNSIDQARHFLEDNSYALVLCDNIFGDIHNPRGSEFIVNERWLFGDAYVVLITGYAIEQIVDRKALEKAEVRVIAKAPGHTKELQDIALKVADNRVENIKRSLEDFAQDLVIGSRNLSFLGKVRITHKLIDRAVGKLKIYLLALPNQEVEQFYIAGKGFSPKSLIRELDEGGEAAIHLVDMFMDDIFEEK